jgi:hypothetical protein
MCEWMSVWVWVREGVSVRLRFRNRVIISSSSSSSYNYNYTGLCFPIPPRYVLRFSRVASGSASALSTD